MSRFSTPVLVEDHPAPEHLVIVREVEREPLRQGHEAGGLVRQLRTPRVGRAHDERQLVERRITQAVLLDERIEAAPVTVVTQLDSFDV